MDKRDKNQIVFVPGGDTFDSRDQYYEYLNGREYDPFERRRRWRDWVEWALSDNWETMTPSMPNKQYADYRSWNIWFEKLFPYLNDHKLVLVGSSLGAVFLAKYLSENPFPKPIDQLHLVAPPFNSEGIGDNKTIGDFVPDPKKLPALQEQAEHIYIYHSKDDHLVPFAHSERYMAHLPQAELFTFEDRGHFLQPAFPELLENISKLDQEAR